MGRAMEAVLEPRKTPVQARSTASVDAILEATTQVLRSVGKEQLTTTKVAARAGVSVGTLYQYFPNKSSLLQAVLMRHLEGVAKATEQACREQQGKTLVEMATGLVDAFLAAKIKDVTTSAAMYSVSADVDGAKIAQRMAARFIKAVVEMLATTSDSFARDPEMVASVLQGTMAGVSRRLLETSQPAKALAGVRAELVVMVSGYLGACAGG